MNRRIYKKLCKRAVPILIERHGYRPTDFVMAEGDETLPAPERFDHPDRHSRIFVRGYFEPLRGTPVCWRRASYEYDEWDCDGACTILTEIEFWENLSPQDLAAMAGELHA